MKYIIGLCGTHNTGKSVIIQGLKAAGIPVNESQLSRTAQTNLGWDSLSRVKESAENMWLLQESILAAMEERDKQIEESKIETVVDRTPADVVAYTLLWMLKYDFIGRENRERYFSFQQKCRTMATRYERFVYFPIREEIPFKVEPQRAEKEDRVLHNRHINNFLINQSAYEVRYLKVEDRLSELTRLYEEIRNENPNNT